MHNLQFYRVESFNYDEPCLANSLLRLKQLLAQFQKKEGYQKITIFYHWKQLQVDKYGDLTLRQIVQEDPTDRPIFFISVYARNDDFCEMHERYRQGIVKMTNTDEKPKQYWIGSNGHVLFDSRNTAILASSVHHATSQSEYSSLKSHTTEKFNSSMIQRQSSIQQPKQGVFKRIFTKLGVISKDPSSKNLSSTIQAIKNIKTKENLKEHISRQYSDYDPKFAAYLESIYLKFAILSAFRIHYVEYKNMDDGIIRRTIRQNDKVGIIGDFGTGLEDSRNLLTDLIINKGANIILHLGDVYYAGTPHEYENHITKILQGIRLKVKR